MNPLLRRTRVEVARFIEGQFHFSYRCPREKSGHHHYGWQEARELMDFLFDGEPGAHDEKIISGAEGERRDPQLPRR